MRYGFVKNNLPPNGYASRAEFFQVFVDFVSRFTQLKTGMPQAFFSFISPLHTQPTQAVYCAVGSQRQLRECLQNSEKNILRLEYPFFLTYRIALTAL
jgi:hypothetical protein